MFAQRKRLVFNTWLLTSLISLLSSTVARAGSGDSVEESFALFRKPSDGKFVLAGSTHCGTGGKDFAVVRVLP